MANCVRCGRKLPFLRGGKNRDVCKWCQEYEAAQRGESVSEYQPVVTPPWQHRRHRGPLVMYVIFGINAAVFLAMALSGSPLVTGPPRQELLQWGANFGPLTLSGEWWRLLSAVFVHIGLIHFAFNMWCLWDLGTLAEGLYGRWTFGAIYLLTGIAASLTTIWWSPLRTSAGASGAIFGIAGALIASLKLGEFSVPSEQIRGVTRSVMLFAVYNLAFGAVSARTDNAAHVGGFVAGLALGALTAKIAPESDLTAKRVVLILATALLLFGGARWLYSTRGYLGHTLRAEELLEQKGKQKEAISELNKVLASRPDDEHARFLLAVAYGDSNQFAQAEEQWQYLLQKYPSDKLARYNLGLVYLNTNRPREAKQQFSQILALDPRSPEGHFGMGLALGEEGDNATAIEELTTAASLAPDLKGVYYNLGTAYLNLKRYDEALSAFQKEIQNSGSSAPVQRALAQVYEAKGMKKEAEDAREKAKLLQAAD
ncbi:MAG TPA: rhomboid family intramembrane serine protease [Terriglobales bacterium]|nr:rhomboid family intramembrane serine protease [Terriglobales bacterium]